jgi:hypothetical protein
MSSPSTVSGALAVLFAACLALGACHADLKFDDVACAQDTDCPLPTLHCLAGACVACFNDTHCTTSGFPRCDVALQRCVQCGVSSDCAANETCKGERCLSLCTGGCPPSAPQCDDSVCGQCDDDDGKTCATTAAPRCYQHQCVACLSDGDCAGATPRCDVVTKACVQCQSDLDCSTAAAICDLSLGRCVSQT